MKKIFLVILLSIFTFANTSFGEYNHSYKEPQYGKVVEDSDLDFEIDRNGSKLELSWDSYNGDDFKWYKIVKSTTNKKPSYPEDNSLKVLVEREKDSEVVYDSNGGYYRLCVIKQNNDRTCSNVVYLEKSSEYKKDYKKDYSDKKKEYIKQKQERVKEHYSDLDKKIDSLLVKFFKKVEDKYETSEKRIEKLEQTKKALENLANKNKKYFIIAKKINIKISKKIQQYDDGLDEIEKIFDL